MVTAHLIDFNLDKLELLEDCIRVNFTCYSDISRSHVHGLKFLDAPLMVTKGVIVRPQSTIRLVCTSLQRLHTPLKIVDFI